MSLNDCKVELKLKWIKHYALAGVGNSDASSNNTIVTIKDTKLYVPVPRLSTRGNQKLSNLLSKGF